MISHRHSWFLRHKKRWIILAIFMILTTLVGVYVFASVKNWESYGQQNAHYLADVQKKTDQVLTKISQSNLKRDEKMRQFDQLSTLLKDGDGRCENSLLFSWQRAFPVNSTKVEDCRNQSKHLSSLRSALDAMVAHLKSEHELAELIIVASSSKTNSGEAEWPSILQQWSTAEDQLRKKNVAKTFEPTKTVGVEKIQAIHGAWRALIDANKAKDRAKYEAAVTSLTQSYGALAEITQTADTALAPLIKNFDQTYKEAFKKP